MAAVHLCHINHYGNVFYLEITIQCIHRRQTEYRCHKSTKLESIRPNCTVVTKRYRQSAAVFVLKRSQMIGPKREATSKMIAIRN